MADTFLSLTDLAKINDKNAKTDLGISDLLDEAPFLKVLYGTKASNGIVHKYLKQTGAPTVGFRAINAGLDHAPSAKTLVSVDLKYMDCGHTPIDVAYVKAAVEDVVAEELRLAIRAAFFAFEQQVINGNNADGFNGLAQTMTALGGMCIGAGGTTANTGSSIYLVRTVPDETGVAAVFGNDGEIKVGDTYLSRETGSNSKKFDAYVTPAGAWLGLQVGSARSLGRIANLTGDNGKGATDNLIYQALATFPGNKQPTHLVMNSRSLEQLRKSRTATNATGAPAPRPTEVDGIPIIVTDAITSTEALIT